MNRLIEAFDFPTDTIPKSTVLNKAIFKKLISENVALDITDKKALRDDIVKINLLNSLKLDSTLINAYSDNELDYTEIAVLRIELSNITRTQRIAHFINKAIPYPLVLVFSNADNVALSVADKRINQADKSKLVLENIWITPWFNPDTPNIAQTKFMQDIAFRSLSFVNFYAFYTDIKDRVVALKISEKTGHYKRSNNQETLCRIKALNQLEQLEQEKSMLQNKLSKEKQMGRQIEIITKIKKIADQIKGLKEQL